MLRKHVLHLLAPDSPPAGGTATADPMLESDPSAMAGWMNALGDLEGSPAHGEPAQAKKEAVTAAAAAAAAAKETQAAPIPPAQTSPAATTPPAETKPKTDDEEKYPRNQDDWTKFKKKRDEKIANLTGEIKSRDDRITAYEARIKELESKGADVSPEMKSQLDRVTKERDDLFERLRAADVERLPKFQKYFKDLVDEQHANLVEILGTEKADAFSKIMQLPASDYKKQQIESFLDDLSTFDQSRVGGVMNELTAIGRRREKAIKEEVEKSKTAGDQNAAERKAFLEKRDQLFTDAAKAIQDGEKGHVAYQPAKDNNPAWNKAVQERISVAKSLLTGTDGAGKPLSPDRIMQACFDAAAMPAVLEAYKADMAEKNGKITALEAQIAKMTASNATVQGAAADAGQVTNGSRGEVKIGMSPQEALAGFTDRFSKQMQE